MNFKEKTAGFCGFWQRRLIAIPFAVGLIAVIILAQTVRENKAQSFSPAYLKTAKSVPVGGILNGTSIRQQIPAGHPIKDISIRLATYAHKNYGNVKFYIKDETDGRILHSEFIDMQSVIDNDYRKISFPVPLMVHRNHQLAFYLEGTADCRPGNAITCWSKKSKYYSLLLNGTAVDRTVEFYLTVLKKKRGSYLFLYLFLAAAIGIAMLFPVDPRQFFPAFLIFWQQRLFALLLLGCLAVLAAAVRFFPERFIQPRLVLPPCLSSRLIQHPSSEIVNGIRIRQSLPLSEPVINIDIRTGTFTRKNSGNLRFYVKNDTTGDILYSQNLKMEKMKDNEFTHIRFPLPLSAPDGHKTAFYLEGTPDCKPGNAVSCWFSEYEEFNAKFVMFRYGILKVEKPIGLIILLVSGFFMMMILKDCFLLRMVNRPENVFLVLALASALVISLCVLPFSILDAPAHLKRICQISEGKLFYRPVDPEISGVEKSWSAVLLQRDMFNLNFRSSFAARSYLLDKEPFDCGEVNQKHYIMGYTPFAYLHSSLAAFFARKVNLSLDKGILMIALACISFYVFFMYLAIRLMPGFKWPALFIALMPGTLWTGISFSADSFVIIVAFLFFAWCMKLRELQCPYTFNELAVLTVLALLLTQCKFVYFPLLALMFLLPAGNFRNRKHYWGFILSVIVSSVFLGWLWNKLATDPTTLWNSDGRTTQEKMLFILTHPWQYFLEWMQALAGSWEKTFGGAVQFLGSKTAPLFPAFYIWFYAFFFLSFALLPEKSLKLPGRLVCLISLLLSLGIIYAAIYCMNSLEFGIQGRYLIPLFPLLFLVLGQDKFGLPEKYLSYYKGFIVIFLIVTQFLTADALRLAYWY